MLREKDVLTPADNSLAFSFFYEIYMRALYLKQTKSTKNKIKN